MIVNKNDFHSFLKKVNNGLGNFNEVIVPYRARSDDEKSAFHFQRFEESKSPNVNFFRTVDPLKILLYLSCEKIYPLKNYNAKRIIMGEIADTKKIIKSFLEIISKGIQRF
jgi:hypothetical protein